MNSVRIISVLADADFSLTCRAIRHLLYYGCIFLLDIFSFSAIYAPTAQFSSTIASDEEMQRECARYVNTRFAPVPINMAPPSTPNAGARASSSRSEAATSSSNLGGHRYDSDDIWPLVGGTGNENGKGREIVDGVGIVELYASLKQGQSVKQWYLKHSRELANIDIRRFITFGIIKGFLYRVHKYAIATGQPAPTPPATRATTPATSSFHGVSRLGFSHASSAGGEGLRSPKSIREHDNDDDHDHDHDDSRYESMLSSSRSVPLRGRPGSGAGSVVHLEKENEDEDEDFIDDKTLSKYLDGQHCFDQICTELEISEKELTARLKRYPGEVLIIHR